MDARFQTYAIQKDEKLKNAFNVVYYSVYYFMCSVLVFAGVAKLYNPFPVLEVLRDSTPVPTLLLIGFVAFIAVFETLLGLMLILRIKVKENLISTGVLFLFIFIFTIYGATMGINGETGCFGGLIKSQFDISMVVKNSIFLLAAISLLIKEIELPE